MSMTPSEAVILQKRVFLEEPEVRQQFDSGTVSHDLFESGSDINEASRMIGKREGDYMVIMAETSPSGNHGTGFVYGDSYAGAGHPTFARLKYVNRDVNSVDAFNMFTVQQTMGADMSVDDLISLQLDSAASRNRKIMNKIFLGDGTGRYTDCVTNAWTDATQKLAVTDVSKFVIGDEIATRLPTAGGFRTGTAVSDYPTTPTGRLAPFKVTDIDASANTLTLSLYNGNAVKEADGDALSAADFDGMSVYRYDAQGKDPWGLRNYCRTGNPAYSGFNPASPTTLLTTESLQIQGLPGGIDRTATANSWFVPTEVNAGGQTISLEDHVHGILRSITKKCGDDVPDLLGITGHEVKDKLASEQNRQGRTDYNMRLRAPANGNKRRKSYPAVQIYNLYVVADNDADPTELLIAPPADFFRSVPRPWMIDETGTSDGLRMLSDDIGRGKPEWDMRWVTSQQLLASRVRACGAIYNILATL